MSETSNLVLHVAAIGVGATLLTDLWSLARRRLWGIALPDYGLVGRWVSHMRHGQFRQDAIARAAPQRAERAIGWIVHYLTGVAFAAALPAIGGAGWLRHPALGPALIVGIGSVAAPFLLMQPAMGAGIAASRTPDPRAARRRSLAMHAVFGLALYAAGWASRAFG